MSEHTRHRSTLADHPDIKGVLPRFIGRLPAHVQRLRALASAGEHAELQRLIHQLRGAGQSYGFTEMSRLAAAAEEKMLAVLPPDEIAAAVESLIHYIEHVEGFGTGS